MFDIGRYVHANLVVNVSFFFFHLPKQTGQRAIKGVPTMLSLESFRDAKMIQVYF